MASDRKNVDQRSLAATAGDQIRAIIEAAEQTAEQIRSEAERDAARMRREAEEEASGIRSDARGEVQALLDSIRAGVTSLGADLQQLHERLQPAAPPPDDSAPESGERPSSEPIPAAPSEDTDADIESARLVALNMALDGASREQVDRYLKENFALSDREALLDDVYASVGG
jgi:small-conductance mechanosensitive channel